MAWYYHKSSTSKSSGFLAKWETKKNIFKVWFIIVSFLILIWIIRFVKNVLRGLPDINKIKDMNFSQATIIQDRKWNELYKLFEENRQYVWYENISINMINAIIAIEDQRYRQHNWLDPMWIIRAWLNWIFHPWQRLQWASTIPQQLVRNLLLSLDRKIERKFKEIILTSRLDWTIERWIHQERWKLNKEELRQEMKKKTLELYLNYISFWNNAFGIESASKTYFDISAKTLNPLQASILASIPKWPSLYNPYKNRSRVIWWFDVKNSYWTKTEFTWVVRQLVIDKLTSVVNGADLSNKRKENWFTKYLNWISRFTVSDGINTYDVEYKAWRKDLVLSRMFEDGYITADQLKQSFIEGLNLQLSKNSFPITAPHFVHWVIEELWKQYDTGTLTKAGLVIKTTLDLDMQKIAEQSMIKNNAVLQDNGATNSAMIYLDSTNWDVLAYVWSLDYFNEQIQWQNDMIRRPRQSWSAIKPFIYALWLEKLPITTETPIYDIPFQIWPDRPNNADDSFEWILPLKKALWHSRNIPSVKMITALWWETVAKPFLQKLWLKWISDNVEYGYTLALWAGEVTMLELANAYAHLSAQWTPAVINPILEIRSKDWSLIYQKTWELQKPAVEPWITYLLWKVLSDPTNRLSAWVSKFNIPGLTYALKTWTSNVKTDKWNRPRDWRLAAYTPSKVAIFRAWNADASPMNKNAFWWTIHANPIKEFYGELLKNNYISNETVKEKDITRVQISKITWRAASSATPSEFVVEWLKFLKSPNPAKDDWATALQYDSYCNGLLSPYTSTEFTRNWYVFSPVSFMPNSLDLNEIKQRWKDSTYFTWATSEVWFASGKVTYNYNNIFIEQPKDMCEWNQAKETTWLQLTISTPEEKQEIWYTFNVSYSITSEKNVRKVMIILDGKQIMQIPYIMWDTKAINDTKQVILWTGINPGDHILQVVWFDYAWFSNKSEVSVKLVKKETDKNIPEIIEAQTKVTKNADWTYAVSINIKDESPINWKAIFNNQVIKEFKESVVSFSIPNIDSQIAITVEDSYKNILNTSIDPKKYMK